MNNKIYIHYGHSHFDSNKMLPIKNNCFLTKPLGGFWASCVNSKFSWLDWVQQNNYYTDKFNLDNLYFKFKLKPSAKVLTITNVSQLEDLPHQSNSDYNSLCSLSNWTLLDFEQLSQIYDAIEVIISSDIELYYQLYGWDCDSILIMNKNIVEEI